MTVRDRFQALDDVCGLISSHLKREEAFRVAYDHAVKVQNQSHSVEVFDLMAHAGKPQCWNYQGDILSFKPTKHI